MAGMLYYVSMQRELRVVVFDKNKLSLELLVVYLREFGISGEILEFTDFVSGFEACRQSAPDFVVVDISENQEFAFDIVSKLYKLGIPVIVSSVSNSSNTIIKALRAGAGEFLTRPVIKSEVFRAVEKILAPGEDDYGEKESRILTLFSGKGGSGKTTIAANLALELAKQTGKKTALIDLNFTLGELSEFLDLAPVFNLSTLLETMDKITSDDVVKMFSKYKDTELYLLSEPMTGENFSSVTFNRITRFLKLLKEEFSYIIVDIPTVADEKIFKVLQISDYVLFVAAMNLNSLKNSKKCIELLKSKGVSSDKIKLLLNRFVESEEHSVEEIESDLGHSVYKKIPNNYFTVMSAINKKISVSEENMNSNVAESIRELALMLSDSIMNNSLRALRGNYEYKRENPEQ